MQPATDANKNIIVGPDYGQMIRQQTNGHIIEAFISMLFSNNTIFNRETVLKMIRNMIILVTIKSILEESKSYFEKFKFTDMNILKYIYQRIRFSENRYDFLLISGKWTFCGKCISTNLLTYFLELKSIYISQPETYYYHEKQYLIKVIVTATKITFAFPKIVSVTQYMDDVVVHKNQEYDFGGKTTMYRISVSPSNIYKLEPVQSVQAFPTENYKALEESIATHFVIDNALHFSSVPFCVNFDGKPGTGKTTFTSYIASSNIFDKIIVHNLVQSGSNSFRDIILSIERLIANFSKEKKLENDSEHILIVLDEIDKWLASYAGIQIDKMREDARNKKQISDEKKPAITTIQTYEKLSEKEESEKKIQLKNEFFDQLYNLVDGHIFFDIRKYVIIFNTNDFSKMFADSDKIYDALQDRFQRYQFTNIGKTEIIAYIKYMTNKLSEFMSSHTNVKTQTHLAVVRKLCTYDEDIFDKIPEDINISYRTLYKILRNNSFKVNETITSLSGNRNFEIFKN